MLTTSDMSSLRRQWSAPIILALMVLMVLQGCVSVASEPSLPSQSRQPSLTSARYAQALVLGEGREWRAYPLLVNINTDGHLDIVATHRNPLDKTLHIWLGTGQGAFNALPQTWTSPGYSGLAAGDINGDGHLDLLAASHFHRIYTFLGHGAGQFTDSSLEAKDGYVAARLSDVNADGNPDAIVLGAERAGIEIYLGDGTGKWALGTRLMERNIGRDFALGDVNADGKLDIVSSFARHGIVVFLRDETGGWVGNPTGFYSASREFRSVALADVNQDGHLISP